MAWRSCCCASGLTRSTSARPASIPIFACSRSRSSSLAIRLADRLRMLTTLCSTTSSTRTFRISSSSCARISSSLGCSPPCCSGGCCGSPSTDGSLRCVGFPGLLDGAPVDLLDRRALCEARIGPLGAILLRQIDLEAEGLTSGLRPCDQPLEHLPGREHAALAEVDHLAVH